MKITVMEFFINKVAGCHLTKKGLHHCFFQMNFAKLFRLAFFQNIFGGILQFLLFLYQCSDTEQYPEKSFQKSSENNCHGFLFQWSCRLWGNWRKVFVIVSFGWIFCEIFQISVFLKKLREIPSIPFRPLWDFTSVLEEVTVFLQVNFDTCPCAALPQQQLFC